MKNIRKKIIMASVCLCMLCWAAMPCFVFGAAETAEIEASKTVSSSTAKPGDEVTYTITATYKATYEDENSALPGFNITDNLPAELECVSYDVKSNSPKALHLGDDTEGNNISVIIKHPDADDEDEECIFSGETVTLTVKAKVKDDVAAGTTITNKAVFDYLENDEEISRTADVTVVAEESGDEPGETPNDTPAELDKSPDCGDHFMDFWWFVDIVKGWIFN